MRDPSIETCDAEEDVRAIKLQRAPKYSLETISEMTNSIPGQYNSTVCVDFRREAFWLKLSLKAQVEGIPYVYLL